MLICVECGKELTTKEQTYWEEYEEGNTDYTCDECCEKSLVEFITGGKAI